MCAFKVQKITFILLQFSSREGKTGFCSV